MERAKDNPNSTSMLDLQKFFSTPDNPVGASEFRAFWMSCSREEKDEFMLQARRDLETDE